MFFLENWHFSLPRMNSFNKTKAAIFPMQLDQAMPRWDIPIFSDLFTDIRLTLNLILSQVPGHHAVQGSRGHGR